MIQKMQFKNFIGSITDFNNVFYNPLKTIFPEAPYFSTTFLSAEKIYFHISSAYDYRYLRYSDLQEFTGYFISQLQKSMETLYLKTLIWLDGQLEGLKDAKNRGEIRNALLNAQTDTFLTPENATQKATPLTDSDYISDRNQNKSVNNSTDTSYNIVNNLRNLLELKQLNEWDEFIQRFNHLFTNYEGVRL